MKPNNRLVGLFVVGGLVLFGIGLFLIGDRHQLFARHREYYSDFVNLAGLANGAKVRVAGMDAGQVSAIIAPDSPSSRFRVRWRIDVKLSGLVRTDSVATIGTEGIVGGTYLAVRQGTAHAAEAAPLAIVRSEEAIGLSDVVSAGAGLLNDARGTLGAIGPKLGVTLDGLAAATSNANDVLIGLKQGRGTAGMLLRDERVASALRATVSDVRAGRGVAGMRLTDEALAGQVRESIASVHQATSSLGHAAGQADVLVSDLTSRQVAQKAAAALDNLVAATRDVRQLLAEVNKPDSLDVTAGANIREMLTNANASAANLADATEALKHNFLTRGFFKDRGYYTLADIPPDAYRHNRIFTSRANQRAWLSGSDLFQQAANGAEELSAKGREILDATFAEYTDAMLDRPVIVEGYSNGAAGTRLRLSRSRALAVRQYLQTRVQIDNKNIGIVPLKDAPPSGLGRARWDGICLVVVNGR